MAIAFHCDECGSFHKGTPAVTLSMELMPGDKPVGPLLGLLSRSEAVEKDFCSIDCLMAYDADELKQTQLADAENKIDIMERDKELHDGAC